MKCLRLKFNKRKLKCSSAIEFLAVFAFLFIFFITILEIGLFFRQVYLVQTIADETISRLTIEKQCSANTDKTAEIANKVISFYYGDAIFSSEKNEGKSVKLADDDERFVFLITCRNKITPDSLIFIYKYKGIFMYRGGKEMSSNISVNTTYY